MVPLGPRTDDLTSIVDEFCARYSHPGTRAQYVSKLHDLFRSTGRRNPAEPTEADLLAWCQAARANNTIRRRASNAATFLRWCQRAGIIVDNPGEALRGPDNPSPGPARAASRAGSFRGLPRSTPYAGGLSQHAPPRPHFPGPKDLTSTEPGLFHIAVPALVAESTDPVMSNS